MQTFKEFISENSREPPNVNEKSSVEEYPDEADRQLKNFYHYMHRPPAKDEDEDAPPQDEKARDAFHHKHGLRKLPRGTSEDHPNVAVRHLDYYHHHYPDVAKSMNMKPMNSFQDKVAVIKDNLTSSRTLKTSGGNALFRAKDKYYGILDAIAGTSIRQKFRDNENKKLGNSLKALANHPGMKELHRDSTKNNDDDVSKFHQNNSDLHHLSGTQVYGHYIADRNKSSSMVHPQSSKEFSKRWDKLKK